MKESIRISRITNVIIPFVEDAAQKVRFSRSTIEQEIRVAEKVAPEVKQAIRNTPLEDSKTDLLQLKPGPGN